MDIQTRESATFVALLSVAVIGVAVGFLRPTVSRLQSRYQVLLSDEKSATTKMVMWMSALLLLISLLTVILGSISSDLLSWDLFRLVTLPILFVWGVLFVMTSRKRKDGESWTRKVDGQGFFHLLSLVLLILGITFDLFGLFGVSADRSGLPYWSVSRLGLSHGDALLVLGDHLFLLVCWDISLGDCLACTGSSCRPHQERPPRQEEGFLTQRPF